MSAFFKSFLAGIAQWPPQPTTVIGLGLIGGGVDFALTGSFAQAIVIAGVLKMLIPDSTPSGDALARLTKVMNAVGGSRAAAYALIVGATVTLAACSTPAQRVATSLATALQAGPAAEAVAYVAAVNPKVSAVLANVDAAVQRDAPTVLKYACGGGSMAGFIFDAAVKLYPTAVSPARVAGAHAALADLNQLCAAPPPAGLADVAKAAVADYVDIMAAVHAAGASPTP